MDEIVQGFCLIEWHSVYESAITILFATLIGVLAYCYRLRQYKKQEKTLYKLAKLRTDGVELRNEGKGVELTDDEFKKWEEKTDGWKEELYETADEFSLVVGERLRTLDLWIHTGFTGEESDRQKKILAYITETLERTDHILEKRFRPTHAP